ncbi:ComEC/Rec2 family competence protein [Treponema sp.]|uniref:ComEC/Rec2 family competence protein n=1 Tax=Treponema sp. TaxID=166 RepID=UPI00298EA218|nr:ComEC/Rec2 family competence protein [Treponema sp.]MCQ2240633.1 ComEC/Rec2 family competence protein [Treponema sp.]
MVGNLKKRLFNPFFVAAFVCAVLIYGGFVKIADRHPLKSLGTSSSITGLVGEVASNPSINSNGRFYSLVLSVERSFLTVNAFSMESSASGQVKCLVPSYMVESLYPGKLFSSFGKKIVFEKGERVMLSGNFSKGFFVAIDGQYLERENNLKGKFIGIRTFSRIQFKRLMYGWKNAGGLILALLSGSREYTEKNVSDNFRNAGLSHILALSGMHLSFFAGLAGGSGKRIFGKKYSFFFRLFGILFFVWFAGLSPSLLRALLCSLIMLLCSSVFSTEADYFLVLCSVFLIHCLVIPADIFSAAFILSYGALAGILLLSDGVNSFLCRLLPGKISSSLSASMGAQCATAPVSIGMFGTIMPCGILASVVVSPLVSLFIFVALLSIILCLVMPFLAPAFGCIMNAIYKVIALTVQLFAFVPPLKF